MLKTRTAKILTTALAVTLMLALAISVIGAPPAGWSADRFPSAEFTYATHAGRDVIRQSVAADDFQADNFRNTQGFMRTIDDVDTNSWAMTASLYVSDDMVQDATDAANRRRTAVWIATSADGTARNAYLILEFRNLVGYGPGWYLWCSIYGTWNNVADHVMGWNTMAISNNYGEIAYFVNGEQVEVVGRAGDTLIPLHEIRQLSNFGYDHTVYWGATQYSDDSYVVFDVELNYGDKQIEVGDTFTLEAFINATYIHNNPFDVLWTVGAEAVVTFDESTGLVTAVAVGVTTIMVEVGGVISTITITVVDEDDDPTSGDPASDDPASDDTTSGTTSDDTTSDTTSDPASAPTVGGDTESESGTDGNNVGTGVVAPLAAMIALGAGSAVTALTAKRKKKLD